MPEASIMHQVVVGLGNPGDNYRDTRHNAGFQVLDLLMKNHKGSDWQKTARGLSARIRIKNKQIDLLKPMTFMNLSGESVLTYLNLKRYNPDEIIVVHDDLDIQLGQIRVKNSGGHAGHNGLRSVIEMLGTPAFPRVRIGIGQMGNVRNTVDYVLSSPQNDDEILFKNAVEQAASAVEVMVLESMKSAMDRFNRKKQPDNQG